MANLNFNENKVNLYNTVFSELKALGVKVPKVKKIKSLILKQETPIRDKKCKVFGVYLCDQEWVSEGEYPLPKFVSMATSYLQEFVQKEVGLFRKAGNFARQKRLRMRIERGEAIQEADPHDVASLLKQWLRELPEPLIPVYLQDIFVRCQCLECDQNRLTACLLTFLLLPPDHLHTLRHMLKFFASIAVNIEKNWMGTYNLALIIAPNLFISNEPIEKTKNNLIYKHTAIVKTLIEHCDKVGEIPPSLTLKQNAYLGSDLYTSNDLLDINSNKSKKKPRNGSVQDIFNGLMKLVGQNPPLAAKAECEDFVKGDSVSRSGNKRKVDFDILSSCKKKRFASKLLSPFYAARSHTLALDDLDGDSAATPTEKDPYSKQVKNAHARRKSFGALLLRKKDKKRREKYLQSESSVSSSKNATEEGKSSFIFNINDISSALTESKFQFNDVNFNNSPEKEDKSNFDCKVDVKEADRVAEISLVAPNKSKIHYSKSCMWSMNRPEIESSCLNLNVPNLNSNEKAEGTDIFLYKPTLSRKEAFIYKNKEDSGICDVKNFDKKEASPKIIGSVQNLSRTCSHSQKSLCNVKCDKNKSVVTERAPGKKPRQESIQEKRSQPRRNNQCPEHISEAKLADSSKKVSSSTNKSRSTRGTSSSPRPSSRPKKTFPNDSSRESSINPSPIVPSLNDRTAAADSFKPQSLDLELNLLLQNFCISPPSDSSEIHLSIDITAAKSSSDVQVNMSQNRAAGREQKTLIKENQDLPKARKRLSSKSDSRIPRWKKLPKQSRPYSFSGSSSEGIQIYKDKKTAENMSKSKTKIPVIVSKSENSGNDSVKDTQDSSTEDSLSNSCYKTPKTSMFDPDSITWQDGSQYLSAISSPDDEIINKRESIARILQENPGHVLAKVNLYDNKIKSSDSSNSPSVKQSEPSEKGRLLRVCSEKYPPGARTKTSNPKTCETTGRSRSVKYKTAYPRINTQSPIKFTLSDVDAPSPLSIPEKTVKKPSPLMTLYKGSERPSSRNASTQSRNTSRFSSNNTKTKLSGVSLKSTTDNPAKSTPLSPLKESTNSEDDVFLEIE